ncbi:MAG TPA: hypothetical protein VJY14_02540 [Aliarcobacter sp.]|nr:hypothetical protein [Aliarcobacter sp.]
MAHYKYIKKVTAGPFGTSIGHRSSDKKEVITLGNIGEYTYIYAEDLSDQSQELSFEEIELDKTELDYLKRNDVYITALEAGVQSKIRNLVQDYPQFEIDTFSTQESEANEYIKDNTTATPFIDNLCLSRGIEKDLMVAKILANAEALKMGTAPIIGNYQKIVTTK